MTTLLVLIVATTAVLAALSFGYAVAAYRHRLRSRRDADAAVTRLRSRYQDAVREMRRRK
ncbi:hypothetical protein [Pseudarthrobacter sp. NIBRBAC000502771]|uniref:hypothetical protein n=1 Tax=Pseudarthrobacter sp. NIBRBAC000502771 TaxID=2590774 RepID=UPI0011301B68|nr:hypothetical protein [Pseudarthrobacter sp. NIBRBAC000502771]QDG64004.1 hypothetical protein NIBR502771_17920 [Pseudarthrobacter sp. NIBRBAC000502771]